MVQTCEPQLNIKILTKIVYFRIVHHLLAWLPGLCLLFNALCGGGCLSVGTE